MVLCPIGKSLGGICVWISVLQEDPHEGSICDPLSYRKGGPQRDLSAVLRPIGRVVFSFLLAPSFPAAATPQGSSERQ